MLNFFKKDEKEPRNLKEILDHLKDLEQKFEKLSQDLKIFKKEGRRFIQKVGIIRFNPFKEIGGDQSFSIALLNGNDDGIVITSLYTREGNRVYGKPIKNGKSEYPLSDEEIKAIQEAQKNYEKRNPSKFNNQATGGSSIRSR